MYAYCSMSSFYYHQCHGYHYDIITFNHTAKGNQLLRGQIYSEKSEKSLQM